MRKKFAKFTLSFAVIALACSIILSGCNMFNCNSAPSERTIQYTNENGVQNLTVMDGETYVLDVMPRFGYDFIGYFDAAEGGTKYTDENGASLAVYDVGKNIVLFPQYKAKEYTLILEADEEASGDFSRSVKIKYNDPLPELPTELTIAHKTFNGWFTQEGGRGEKIADRRGVLPEKSIFNKDNYNLTAATESIRLYADFGWQKYNVTFRFGNGLADETLSIDYGTDVSKILPSTRNKEGKGVISWSTSYGGEPFNGKILDETTLYALEWAPVIELNANGGDALYSVVAREGEDVVLPTPVRKNYKFVNWVYESGGEVANITKMPAEGAKLKAQWQAMIVFDENGGSAVEDILKTAGESITLPTPEREGYLFAGWYTEDKQIYTGKTMPTEGLGLKAGWYAAKEQNITVVNNELNNKIEMEIDSYRETYRKKIDISSYLPTIPNYGLQIKYTLNFKWGSIYKDREVKKAGISLYQGSELNSAYLLKDKPLSHAKVDSYIKDNLTGVSIITSNVLYIYYYGLTTSGSNLFDSSDPIAFYDIYLELTYPDTTTLYL